METQQIDVVFDTSLLCSLRPNSLQIRVLRELVNARVVRVHVPTIVEMELATQQAKVLEEMYKDSFRFTEWLSEGDRDEVAARVHQINEVARCSRMLFEKGINEWLNELQAIRHRPSSVDVDKVFELYFAGGPPFRAQKSREDLPDAFIHAVVSSLASQQSSQVHVLTRDSRLANACNALDRVQCDRDLSSLFQLEAIISRLSAANILLYCRDRAAELTEMLKPALCQSLIGQWVAPVGLPSYNDEGEVKAVGHVQSIELQLCEMLAIAEDAVNIPLWVTISANRAHLLVEKASYYSLPSEEAEKFSIVGLRRDGHYLLLDTEVTVEMWALVTVEVMQVRADRYCFGAVEVSETDDPAVV